MHGADPAYVSTPEGMAEQMRKLQPEHLQRAMGALEDIGISRSVGLRQQSGGCLKHYHEKLAATTPCSAAVVLPSSIPTALSHQSSRTCLALGQ